MLLSYLGLFIYKQFYAYVIFIIIFIVCHIWIFYYKRFHGYAIFIIIIFVVCLTCGLHIISGDWLVFKVRCIMKKTKMLSFTWCSCLICFECFLCFVFSFKIIYKRMLLKIFWCINIALLVSSWNWFMEAFFGFNLFENFTGTCSRELPSEFA